MQGSDLLLQLLLHVSVHTCLLNLRNATSIGNNSVQQQCHNVFTCACQWKCKDYMVCQEADTDIHDSRVLQWKLAESYHGGGVSVVAENGTLQPETNISKILMESVSANGRLEQDMVSVNSTTIEGITCLVYNLLNLIVFNINCMRLIYENRCVSFPWQQSFAAKTCLVLPQRWWIYSSGDEGDCCHIHSS